MGAPADITGQRFGRLVALEATERRDTAGSVMWRCLCDCGDVHEASGSALVEGKVASCGCLYRDTRREAIRRRTDYIEGTCITALDRKAPANSTSGIKGVSYDKRSGKWRARITFGGERRSLGAYDDIASAAEARREAELELFGPMLEEHGRSLPSEAEWDAMLAEAVAAERTRTEAMGSVQ